MLFESSLKLSISNQLEINQIILPAVLKTYSLKVVVFISLVLFIAFWRNTVFFPLQCEIYSFDENGSDLRNSAVTDLRYG